MLISVRVLIWAKQNENDKMNEKMRDRNNLIFNVLKFNVLLLWLIACMLGN